MRYFDTATRTEVLPGIHSVTETVVELPDDHPFFSPIPPGMRLDFGPDGLPTLVQQQAPVVTVAEICSAIDAAADTARRAVAGDPLRAVEYEKAAAEAAAFRDSGYPAGVVPRTVSAWAINGRTAQQAADSILAEAAAYTEALYQIRETRLGAKEQVRQAMAANQVEQARLIASTAIDSIRAAINGIGNPGA
ncbi:TPA: phage tail protein [Pseudomonas aeruginosa]|jgi:hypothetical protein